MLKRLLLVSAGGSRDTTAWTRTTGPLTMSSSQGLPTRGPSCWTPSAAPQCPSTSVHPRTLALWEELLSTCLWRTKLQVNFSLMLNENPFGSFPKSGMWNLLQILKWYRNSEKGVTLLLLSTFLVYIVTKSFLLVKPASLF